MSAPIAKSGDLICEPWLAFVRRLECYWCRAAAPSQAHHHPARARGFTDDSATAPVCASCHMRCHGNRVNGKPTITAGEQDIAVAVTRSLFLDRATPHEWAAYLAARKRRDEQRVYGEAVPW